MKCLHDRRTCVAGFCEHMWNICPNRCATQTTKKCFKKQCSMNVASAVSNLCCAVKGKKCTTPETCAWTFTLQNTKETLQVRKCLGYKQPQDTPSDR